jgi:hypothetical protein
MTLVSLDLDLDRLQSIKNSIGSANCAHVIRKSLALLQLAIDQSKDGKVKVGSVTVDL